MHVQQSADSPSCSCIGSLFAPEEKWFLARKPDLPDWPVPASAHSRNRSSQLRLETEEKPGKRSLRKRPSSNAHLPTELPAPLLLGGNAGNAERIGLQEEHYFSKEYSFSIIEDLPASTARQSQQIPPPALPDRPPPTAPLLPLSGAVFGPPQGSERRGSPQRCCPLSLPFLCHPLEAEHRYQQSGAVPSEAGRRGRTAREGCAGLQEAKVHFPLRWEQQESESWMPLAGREELLIEDFDRLFRLQEHQSQADLAPHRSGRPREAKRSKRTEKQLVGRLAESDDEACSESAPSEVIGKGFESHFHNAFWETEDGQLFEETLATRSTNTKLSQWRRGDKFCNEAHFRSDSHI